MSIRKKEKKWAKRRGETNSKKRVRVHWKTQEGKESFLHRTKRRRLLRGTKILRMKKKPEVWRGTRKGSSTEKGSGKMLETRLKRTEKRHI